jgi:hypothetical protein
MNMKCPHPILLLYGIGVAAYAVLFHLSGQADSYPEGGVRFVGLAGMPLIIIIIAGLWKVIANHLWIECDEDDSPSAD